MTDKMKDDLMITILPALIRKLGNLYSAYALVDYANSIIHNLEELGYFNEEESLQTIFSNGPHVVPLPYIGDPPNFRDYITTTETICSNAEG